MYSVVMMMALSGAAESPDLFFRRRGCCGCHGYPVMVWGCYGCAGYYGGPVAPARPASTTYYPSGPVPHMPGADNQTQFVSLQDGDARRAVIRVTVPAGTRLTFNGWTSSAGTTQFRSPPLEPGKDYSYTVRAELVRDGQTLVQTQQVVVRAGQETRVPVQFPTEVVGQR